MPKSKAVTAASIAVHVPSRIPTTPKFRTIVADPPWSKNQSGAFGACRHYPLMSLDQIKSLPVSELAAKNAHLWLWVTNSNVEEGLEVIKSWGFTYRTMFHWIKPHVGLGVYLRNASETCLFATRGKAPVKFRSQVNWMFGNRTSTHSEKPRGFISIVERVSPGPYCELFCRKRPASTEHWWVWGNEVESNALQKAGADFFIPGYPVPKYSFEPSDDKENSKRDKEENV